MKSPRVVSPLGFLVVWFFDWRGLICGEGRRAIVLGVVISTLAVDLDLGSISEGAGCAAD